MLRIGDVRWRFIGRTLNTCCKRQAPILQLLYFLCFIVDVAWNTMTILRWKFSSSNQMLELFIFIFSLMWQVLVFNVVTVIYQCYDGLFDNFFFWSNVRPLMVPFLHWLDHLDGERAITIKPYGRGIHSSFEMEHDDKHRLFFFPKETISKGLRIGRIC